MADLEKLTQLLTDLGLGKTEASAYLQLLLMADEGPATGYQVAKKLGKDPNTVYRALEELAKRGAVEVSTARGREYRPIPPEMLTEILKTDYAERILYTAAHLRSLPRTPPTHEVYQIQTVAAVLERFRQLLSECRAVALLDLSPGLLARFAPQITAALGRGVAVVARFYEEPDCETLANMDDLVFTVEPDGRVAQELMPGQVLRGVFDCAGQIMAYLPPAPEDAQAPTDQPLSQAMWTAGPLLAYQAHNGLAGEIIHTELRAMLRGGNAPDEMQARQDWLARKIHHPVNWEDFWRKTGLCGQVKGAARGLTPWSPEPTTGVVAEAPEQYGCLAAELLERKRRSGGR